MLVITLGQILALCAMGIVGMLLSRVTRLDMTLSCLLVGFIAGLSLTYFSFDTGIRAHNLQDIVFFIVLPVLIFEAAWHLKPKLLGRWLIPVIMLATVGVVISCIVTAVLVYLGIGHSVGFPWIAAFIVGAILAATDPVAVIGQLKRYNAPEDLAVLFEGESLFNDATAVVLFSIVLGLATQSPGTQEGNYLGLFALVFFGGIVVGVLVGLVSAIVILFIGQSPISNFVLVCAAFGSFYVAEHLLHMSGIMAVMASAMVLRLLLGEVEHIVADGSSPLWEWMGLAFNSLLFVIMGLVVTIDMFKQQWLAMLIAIVAALIGRAVTIFSAGYATRSFVYNIPRGWQLLLFWGGLKGAIAIALVLSLPVELPYWWTIQSMVFGVVLFSLLVQGTTNGLLIRKYS